MDGAIRHHHLALYLRSLHSQDTFDPERFYATVGTQRTPTAGWLGGGSRTARQAVAPDILQAGRLSTAALRLGRFEEQNLPLREMIER
jgi:hypothetical protein